MKLNLKKYILPLLALVFAGIFIAHPAQASLFDIGGKAISYIFLWIANFVGWIGGLIIFVLTWAIAQIFQLNMGVVNNSAAVKAGFPIMLSIANLGFVLAVIFIAISTILRRSDYTIKGLLPKVVIMAVIVNFGLVIAGGLLNFSDSLTNYYLDALTTKGGASEFASVMTAAFNPQKLYNPQLGVSTSSESGELTKNSGTSYPVMVVISGAFMTVIGVIMIVITLATFVIMLIIRYATLVFLLVLLPVAWAASVFPKLSNLSSKWWSKFTSQLIFPPVALFFLWLAIKANESTIQVMGSPDFSNSVVDGAAKASPFVASLMGSVLNTFVLCAMMGGGLFIANYFGGAGANIGIGWKNSVKKWGEDKAKRIGLAPVRGVQRGANVAAQKAQTGFANTTLGKKLRGWQDAGGNSSAFVRGAAAPLRAIGRGVENMNRAQEGRVKEEKKGIDGLSKDQLIARIGAARGPEFVAMLEKAQKEGWIKDIIKKDPRILQNENEEQLKRYGAAKLAGEIATTTAGATGKDKETGTPNSSLAENKSVDELTKSIKEMVEGLKDAKKADLQSLFGDKAAFGLSEDGTETLRLAWARNLAGHNPAIVPSVMKTLKGDTLSKFAEYYEKELDTLIGSSSGDAKTKLEKRKKNFRKAIDRNEIGGDAGGDEANPPAAPTTPPSPDPGMRKGESASE